MTCSLLCLVPQPNITWTRPQVLLVTHSSFFGGVFWEGGGVQRKYVSQNSVICDRFTTGQVIRIVCVPGYMHECMQNLSTATPPTIPQRHQCDHSWPQASGITKTAVAFFFFSLVSHWLVTVCHQWNVCIHMSTRVTDSVLSIRGWMLRTECLSTYPCSYFSCVVLFILSC